MKHWTNLISKFYYKVINSIAFYPTLIALLFLVCSIVVMSIEFNSIVIEFKSSVERVLVHNADNARLILGTIVGSIISLMVFSFSMVMIVLNRATSTLSPRVIPGLISDKFHQIVLGFYLGSIIFSLILIVNIEAPNVEFSVPSLGIFFSMLFAIICMGLFVYFIHSISQKIQVDYILNDIYKVTRKELEKVDEQEAKVEVPNTDDWIECKADDSGYIKKIDEKGLKLFCEKNDVRIKIELSLGAFVMKGYPFLKIDKDLEEEVKKDVLTHFTLYTEERISDHYSFGFKQISEIAVKALSPGINDPGTASKAIDLLSDLFIKLIFVTERNYVLDKDDEVCVFLRPLPFEELMTQIIIPIREYGKKDISIMVRLLDCLKYMLYVDQQEKRFNDLIRKFIFNLVVCSKEYINNELDKEHINKRLKVINRQLDEDKQIELL